MRLSGGGRVGPHALVSIEVAPPGLLAHGEADRVVVVEELDAVERQPVRLVLLARRLRQRRRDPPVIECRPSRASLGVDDDELASLVRQVVAVPEPRTVAEPVRVNPRLVDPLLGCAPTPAELLCRGELRQEREEERHRYQRGLNLARSHADAAEYSTRCRARRRRPFPELPGHRVCVNLLEPLVELDVHALDAQCRDQAEARTCSHDATPFRFPVEQR